MLLDQDTNSLLLALESQAGFNSGQGFRLDLTTYTFELVKGIDAIAKDGTDLRKSEFDNLLESCEPNWSNLKRLSIADTD